jgi:hypothetical protein
MAAKLKSLPDSLMPGASLISFERSCPKMTADSLHVYANLLFIRELFLEALDANSGEEIAKYTLVSAVRRITGKYHDREVSGIMGAFLGRNDYDETAHRVWRNLSPACR